MNTSERIRAGFKFSGMLSNPRLRNLLTGIGWEKGDTIIIADSSESLTDIMRLSVGEEDPLVVIRHSDGWAFCRLITENWTEEDYLDGENVDKEQVKATAIAGARKAVEMVQAGLKKVDTELAKLSDK